MAKKYANRPAFTAKDVFASMETAPDWMKKKKRHLLEAHPIGQTGVMVTTTWGYVNQRWLEKTKDGFKSRSVHTYVPSGTILVPRYVPVEDWEIEVIKKSKTPLEYFGIRLWIDQYYILILMQDDNLEAAIRQQEHIGDTYNNVPKTQTRSFANYFRALTIERIVSRIERRKTRLEKARDYIELSLKERRDSLTLIIKNSPAFTGKDDAGSHKTSAANALISAIRTCEEFPMRPVGKNLRIAKISLLAAIRHLELGGIEKAKFYIEKAILRMVYPREEVLKNN